MTTLLCAVLLLGVAGLALGAGLEHYRAGHYFVSAGCLMVTFVALRCYTQISV